MNDDQRDAARYRVLRERAMPRYITLPMFQDGRQIEMTLYCATWEEMDEHLDRIASYKKP